MENMQKEMKNMKLGAPSPPLPSIEIQKLNFHEWKSLCFQCELFERFFFAFWVRTTEQWKKKKKQKKKMKNQMKKQFKKYEISEDFSGVWLRTQHPRRFPGFAVVVVTYFVEILESLTISMILFRNVCLFPEENQQPVLRGHRFSEEKCQFSSTTHILPTKINEYFRQGQPLSQSNNNKTLNTNHQQHIIEERERESCEERDMGRKR